MSGGGYTNGSSGAKRRTAEAHRQQAEVSIIIMIVAMSGVAF